MSDRVRQLVSRAKMGDITDREEAELQQLLLGLAPSSPEFQEVSRVLNQSPKAGLGNPLDNARGVPTLDILSPLGRVKEGIGDYFSNVGKGQEEFYDALAQSRSGLPVIDEPKEFINSPQRLNAAEDNDLTGIQPLGSNATTSEMGMGNRGVDRTGKSAMGGPLSPTQRDAGIDPIGMLPQGYSFSDGGAAGLAMYGMDQGAYLTNYAQSKGGGANMAAFLADPYKSALAMARSGLLGGGYGDTLNAGAGMGQAGVMSRAEDFLNEISGSQGGMVDPDMIVDEMIRRGGNTDYAGMISPETNLPYTPHEIISLTNQSLMAAAPFMDSESAAFWESMLQGKAREYITKLANGEIDANTSYPAWLESEGIQDLMG